MASGNSALIFRKLQRHDGAGRERERGSSQPKLKPRAAPVARVGAGSSRARVFYCGFHTELWDELLVAELPAQV